uniref:Uncharacterized protein n=1 Tax=Prolemur simus TaxID=1328070 RepID=A0A8C9AP36_PROSS
MQGQKRDIGYFDNLKGDSRNVTNSMTFSTKSSSQNCIIFSNQVRAIIVGYKGCDFLTVPTKNKGCVFVLIRGTLTHFLMAEFGCLASTPTSSSTIPFAWEALLKGLAQTGFLTLFIGPLLVSLVTTEPPGSTTSTTIAQPDVAGPN